MWFAPVRIRKETLKVEMSKLHWAELAKYSFLFAAEKDFLSINNRNDIRGFLERAIDKYEFDIFKIRKKAFDKENEGKDKASHNQLVIYSDEILCVSTLRGDQSCDTMNGGSCIKCSFGNKMADLEIKLLGCTRGYETSIRNKARIEAAEEIFDDLVELIIDREYLVSPLNLNHTKLN